MEFILNLTICGLGSITTGAYCSITGHRSDMRKRNGKSIASQDS